MPNPIHHATPPESPKHPFTSVGVALGWRHSAVVGRRGTQLVTGLAAGITRQRHETQEGYVGRITDTARRYARVLGHGTVTAVAGLKLGSGGTKLRADLDRLREVHAAVHTQLPDAEAVTPTVGERSDYPAALTTRPAPRWVRHANEHPAGDRTALRTAWDATTTLATDTAPRSPAPPPRLSMLPDGVGSAPGVPAGRPGGGGAPAGAEPVPGGTVPTPAANPGHPAWVGDAIEASNARDTAELPPAGDLPPELRDRLSDHDRILVARGRDYAAARAPVAAALHQAAQQALAETTRAAARQRLPARLLVTQRYDPRVLQVAQVDACAVEDAAYGRPWLLRRVRIGEGDRQTLEWWHTHWRSVGLGELIELPALHGGKPRVVVLRGRREPTRLALAAQIIGGTALAAAAGMWVATHLTELVTCVAALAVGLSVTARRRHARRWWPRP